MAMEATSPPDPVVDDQAQFASILRDARSLYAEVLEDDDMAHLEDFATPQMRTAAELIAVIESQNAGFEQFRARRQRLLHLLDVAMKPVEIVGDVVAGAAGEVFPPSQNVYAAVMYLVRAAHGVSDFFDAIADLLSQIQDFTARLKLYVQPRLSPDLRAKIVEILAAVFEVLVLATRAIRRGRLRAYFRNLLGPDSRVPEALKKLARLTEAEERLVIAETHATVKKSVSNQERLAEMMSRVDVNVQTLRAETREKAIAGHRDRLKEILKPSVFPEDSFLAFDKSRTHGTCDWILDDSSLRSWLDGEARFLWICGSPGTGKSYVVSRLIAWANEMLTQSAFPTPTSVAFFFFRENNLETRSVLQALRDVAYQLANSDAYYAKQLTRQLNDSDDIKTIPSAFRRLLIEPYASYSVRRRVFILLDGLDEAEQGELAELLSLMDDLRGQAGSFAQVHIALVGRTHLSGQLTAALSRYDGQLRTIHVTADRNGQDVLAFIVEGVQRARILRGSSQDLKDEIIDTMAEQVAGLFILAQFMLADLNRKRHPRRILESLRNYPKEIDGMLHQTLSGLSETLSVEEVDDLNEMLRWVTCAESPLTVAKMEAILSLKFGDPPLCLEESLRGPYSCFFVLDRDDGLTTADLHDRHESHRRPSASGDPGGHSTLVAEPHGEMEFASNKNTTEISFFHACITAFFKDHRSSVVHADGGGAAIGFDLGEARLSVAKTCVRIFTDPDFFSLGDEGISLQQYAGWYWQEHLRQVDLSVASVPDKQQIGRSIWTMLTDETVILTWTNIYGESLGIFTDENIDGLRRWLTDPDVLNGFAPDAQAAARAAVSKPNGIVEHVGRVYANAWLMDGFSTYLPTLFCFGIVQSVAFMEDGLKWSDAEAHWNDIPMKSRIERATRWAQLPPTAHSERRTGSTYLSLRLHNEALSHYNEALRLDPDILETFGRIGVCYSRNGEYQKALVRYLMCEFLEQRDIKSGVHKTQQQRSACLWRLYKDQFEIAYCYYQLDRLEDSLGYFRKAIVSTYDPQDFEAELAYLEVLACKSRHGDVMALMTSMEKLEDSSEESRLVAFLLHHAMGTAVMDWIPRAATRTSMTSFMIRQYQAALVVAERLQDAAQSLVLQLGISALHAESGNIQAAIAIDETVCFITSRPRGSLRVRLFATTAFRHLARLYHQQALSDGTGAPWTNQWIVKLEKLAERQRTHQTIEMPLSMHGKDVIDALIYLGLFYRLRGQTKESKSLFSSIIRESLAILDDEEPDNDEFACDNIVRVLAAWGDLANARALCQSMRRPPSRRRRTLAFAQEWSAGPDSIEPLLPDIQSLAWSCQQCLDTIEDEETTTICHFCLRFYCLTCVETVIKVPGATRSASPPGRERAVCKQDHAWLTIPPLDRDLNRGEILLDTGAVKKLSEWKDELRERWMGWKLEER